MTAAEVFGTPLAPLPGQPDGVAWPTRSWPRAEPANAALDRLLDEAFDDDGQLAPTYAVAVVEGGVLVRERYGGRDRRGGTLTPVGEGTALLSWSIAKSVLHGVVGVVVGDGRLDLDAPAPVAAWSAPSSDGADGRASITVRQLLEMRDGLDFVESYVESGVSDVREMLWGAGRHDVAAFAADRPLAAVPGSRFHYSSGTSNIVSGIVAGVLGPGERYREFLAERLFGPLGMTSATATFDAAGTWVASSYLYATARDFARFGLLYLRDGIWDDRRILPRGWVDQARTPRSVDPDDGAVHGAHWWVVGDDHGSFWASGYRGQSLTVCPGLDLVVVRLGDTADDGAEALRRWRAAVVAAVAGQPSVATSG